MVGIAPGLKGLGFKVTNHGPEPVQHPAVDYTHTTLSAQNVVPEATLESIQTAWGPKIKL